MALNYLLHRHQVSLMRSEAASTAEARVAHRGLARGYAEQIKMLRIGCGGVETTNVT